MAITLDRPQINKLLADVSERLRQKTQGVMDRLGFGELSLEAAQQKAEDLLAKAKNIEEVLISSRIAIPNSTFDQVRELIDGLQKFVDVPGETSYSEAMTTELKHLTETYQQAIRLAKDSRATSEYAQYLENPPRFKFRLPRRLDHQQQQHLYDKLKPGVQLPYKYTETLTHLGDELGLPILNELATTIDNPVPADAIHRSQAGDHFNAQVTLTEVADIARRATDQAGTAEKALTKITKTDKTIDLAPRHHGHPNLPTLLTKETTIQASHQIAKYMAGILGELDPTADISETDLAEQVDAFLNQALSTGISPITLDRPALIEVAEGVLTDIGADQLASVIEAIQKDSKLSYPADTKRLNQARMAHQLLAQVANLGDLPEGGLFAGITGEDFSESIPLTGAYQAFMDLIGRQWSTVKSLTDDEKRYLSYAMKRIRAALIYAQVEYHSTGAVTADNIRGIEKAINSMIRTIREHVTDPGKSSIIDNLHRLRGTKNTLSAELRDLEMPSLSAW